jgi:hypothetical protein
MMLLFLFSVSVSASQVFQLTIYVIHRILNNHSDDKSLVEAVKRHFVAEYVFSDQHQEKPFLRWRERGSFVDSALLERLKEFETTWEKMMKELEATLRKALKKYEENNSDDEAKVSVNAVSYNFCLQLVRSNVSTTLHTSVYGGNNLPIFLQQKRIVKTNSKHLLLCSPLQGLFQEDPLACVLGNPGNNTEIIKPSE